MATFTYNITSPGPADGSPSPQLHTVRLLEAYTPDPWSDEEPQHLLPMPIPMPVPLFSASGDLSKDAASEVFADFSALPSTVSGLDEINWNEWILFDSSPVDATPPSLQLSDISDDPIEEAHPSQSDVADDPPNRREPTPPLASDNREGNTLKEPLNYSDSSIEADPRPGEELYVQVHRSEQIIPLVSGRWEGDALGETLDNLEYIILPLSQVKILKLVYKRDGDEMYQIVGWIDLQETRGYGTQGKWWKCLVSAGRVPGGYEVSMEGWNCWQLTGITNVVERGHVDYVSIDSRWPNFTKPFYFYDVERESWHAKAFYLSTAETAVSRLERSRKFGLDAD
ncbi:predicted protein [Histoplasma mississippiense (nom. inval.)]|uniref:predicted protein n=1 Tax=Ajellomyces capsulatus (strain NAm1 / WU24) TaxID=2059318 RepID=UPI000157C4A7|nr:predicted protein [Histoplasma mississippiense (nom. inval.)]EDN08218.1 predicted protein [Histoplasma mississippiense (nom. inval.)]